ncbi:FCD domain-containing protein [Hydrogenibacillus schlegelii]|uniref:FCD domain-containing protein n=1 Tax=Hydrogenibacillus schlegelii TaxID=1484 RepID=UPI0012E3CB39|nr:FCD domain-containing protein [Hydrogenibacillus schlegelii]
MGAEPAQGDDRPAPADRRPFAAGFAGGAGQAAPNARRAAEAPEDALVQVHRRLLRRPGRFEAVIGDHRAIAAVGRVDPAAARRAMARHLGRVERWIGCRGAVPRRGPKTEGRAGR